MKLYIFYKDGVWGEDQFRADFMDVPKEVYNAQGWFDLDPTPLSHLDIDYTATFERYFDADNIVRYKWTTVRKTGDALKDAIRDKWAVVRSIRAGLLEKSDYTQLPDAVLTPEMRQKWVEYRAALRDLTIQGDDPFTLSWPVSPDNFAVPIGVTRV